MAQDSNSIWSEIFGLRNLQAVGWSAGYQKLSIWVLSLSHFHALNLIEEKIIIEGF